MKTFNVVVHYEGAFDYAIEAETEEEAKEKAEHKFNTEDPENICNSMCDAFACDCWEI